MLTSQVEFPPAIRGDTWGRLVPLELLGPDGKTRTPLTPAQLADLAARFTLLRFQVRDKYDGQKIILDLSSEAGEIRIDPDLGGVVLEASAAKTSEIEDGQADLQATEPRPGHPRGDLVWTMFYGPFKTLKDITRP